MNFKIAGVNVASETAQTNCITDGFENTLSLVFPNSMKGKDIHYRKLSGPFSVKKFIKYAKHKISMVGNGKRLRVKDGIIVPGNTALINKRES